MKKTIALISLVFLTSCKRYNVQSVRVDTLRITEPQTNSFDFKKETDTVYIKNNTIIHTQDSGCNSTMKIITNSTKEYLPSKEISTTIESPFFSKSIKRIIYISLAVFVFGTAIASVLLVTLIIKR
jgi:hypothetical protein